jgi:UDP-3-O-[3-hydroxymyristoyl] glucosamine N-acyltransferase
MTRTLAEWGALVSATVVGDGSILIAGAATPEAACETDLAFLQDARSLHRLNNTKSVALLVRPAEAELPEVQRFSRLIVADPHAAILQILHILRPPHVAQAGIAPTAAIHPTAVVDPSCSIGAGVSIEADVVIGPRCVIHAGVVIGPGCRLGADVTIHPNAVLYADCVVDDRALIHANAVIGADGFGYKFVAGRFEKIPQLGWVHIGADVEIGACTTIDRGAIGATVIGAGTKIDNLVQIAHNCVIGQHNAFASQVGVAGSCTTGDYVRLGGQAGIKDHLTLHTGCSIGAKSGLHKDVPAGEIWIGFPATPEAEQKRLVFSLRRVPDMRDQLKALDAQVKVLTAQLALMSEQQQRAA